MVIPTLVLATALAWGAHRLWNLSNLRGRRCILALSLPLAVPGLLMGLYYLRAFEPAAWFYQFRAARCSELAAAGIGLISGIAMAWLGDRKSRWGISRSGIIIASLGCLLLPYAKPIVFPADYASFRDMWDGAVCRQSTPYSCGPAAAGTILQHGATELELARRCYTSRQGTENWYLAREFRRRGLSVQFITGPVPPELLTNCIAGVRRHGRGHFIAILQKDGDRYLVGDPMIGQKWYDLPSLKEAYDFTGFFMRIERAYETSLAE